MNLGKAKLALVAAAVMVVGAWGCGSGAPPVESSTKEATVKGVIKVKGKPIKGGTIVFDPSNIKRLTPPRRAEIKSDGSYSVTTMVGSNNITIEAPEAVAAGAEAELIQYDVKDGENTYDINLPIENPAG